MAHRCSCHCQCRCQRKMDRPRTAPIVQNNYYYHFVSPQMVLVGPNQQLPQIILMPPPVAKLPAPSAVRASVPEKPKHYPGSANRYAINNDKWGDKHREPRPTADDKHPRCGMKNAKSGEKHRDARRQTAGGAANDKKVRETHHHVKGEPKQKAHVDAKPRVKCANGGTRHRH